MFLEGFFSCEYLFFHSGAPSIRAYGVVDRFVRESEEKVDFNQQCFYPGMVASRWVPALAPVLYVSGRTKRSKRWRPPIDMLLFLYRWLAVRLEIVGNCIIFLSALFAVLGRGSISPGLVGLSVTYALQVRSQIEYWQHAPWAQKLVSFRNVFLILKRRNAWSPKLSW